jgi:hypothetical protein
MVNDIRQMEIHTPEPLVPEPGPFEAEIAAADIKRSISPGIDEFMAELI